MNEYKLEVILDPHEHDNPVNPYYWCLFCWNGNWYNAASGWEKTPEDAFHAGQKAYQRIKREEVKST